ncbi:Transposase family Tnp2 protein [Ceratobasidium sp. AG-Ba]|nr:Transposase family Tnp2 protein [Ceratobasidium sp. AG-Ba]
MLAKYSGIGRAVDEGLPAATKILCLRSKWTSLNQTPTTPTTNRIDFPLLRNLLIEHLADLDDDEWEALQARELNAGDRKLLELLATRLRTHFSRSTWNDLRLGPGVAFEFSQVLIPSPLTAALTRECSIIRPSSLSYGRYIRMPLWQKKLRYRNEADQDPEPGIIHDVFDGEDYRRLRATPVNPPGGYHFVDNAEDVALGLSTDGVTLFKRRRRGLSTAWPIILINYNLHPRYRTKLENILCVGVIPGPTQCKDINSFLTPLLDELLELEEGVECHGLNPRGWPMYFHSTRF